jgi:carbamoyltransferase
VYGPAEIGPRALGHRSLLGDPRSISTRDKINELKIRQWWRPVAPIILAEHVDEWFQIKHASPYMLEAPLARRRTQELAPAVVHLDGTSRIQTLERRHDPTLHDLISHFHEHTGIPLICNSSLNDRGEPIVNRAGEALAFCVRKNVRTCYIDGKRIRLRQSGQAIPKLPATRKFSRRWASSIGSNESSWRSWIDRGYSPEALYLLARRPELREENIDKVNDLVRTMSQDPRFHARTESYIRMFGPGSGFRTSHRRYGPSSR